MKASTVAQVSNEALWLRTRNTPLLEKFFYASTTTTSPQQKHSDSNTNRARGPNAIVGGSSLGSSASSSRLHQSVEMIHHAMIDSSLKTRANVELGGMKLGGGGTAGPRSSFLDLARFVSLLLTRAQQSHRRALSSSRRNGGTPRGAARGGGEHEVGDDGFILNSDAYDIITPTAVITSDSIPLPSVALRQMFRRSIENDADVLKSIHAIYQQLAAAGCTSLSDRVAVSTGKKQLAVSKEAYIRFIRELSRSFLGPTLLALMDQIPMDHKGWGSMKKAAGTTTTAKQQQQGGGVLLGKSNGGDSTEDYFAGDPEIATFQSMNVNGKSGAPGSFDVTCKVGIPDVIAKGEWAAVRASTKGAARFSGPKKAQASTVIGGVPVPDFVRKMVDIALVANSEDFALPVNLKESVLRFFAQVGLPATKEVMNQMGVLQSQYKLKEEGGGPTTTTSTRSNAERGNRRSGVATSSSVALIPAEQQPVEAGQQGNYEDVAQQRYMHHQGIAPSSTGRRPKGFGPRAGGGGKFKLAEGEHTVPHLPGVQQPHSQFLRSLAMTESSPQGSRATTAPGGSTQFLPPLTNGGGTHVEAPQTASISCSNPPVVDPEENARLNKAMGQCGTTISLQPLNPDPEAVRQKLIKGRVGGGGEGGFQKWRPPTRELTSTTEQRAQARRDRFPMGEAAALDNGRSLILQVVNEKTAIGRRVRLAEMFPMTASSRKVPYE